MFMQARAHIQYSTGISVYTHTLMEKFSTEDGEFMLEASAQRSTPSRNYLFNLKERTKKN